jgi:hypothetical protein
MRTANPIPVIAQPMAWTGPPVDQAEGHVGEHRADHERQQAHVVREA